MKDRKGFTLVELIVIIVILGVIMVFALPNITSTLERNKKDQMILDATDMVAKAKNYISAGKANYPTPGNDKELKLETIDPREEIKDSPFGHGYDRTNSYVKITLDSGIYKYTVCLDDDHNTLNSEVSDLSKDNKYTKIAPGNNC